MGQLTTPTLAKQMSDFIQKIYANIKSVGGREVERLFLKVLQEGRNTL